MTVKNNRWFIEAVLWIARTGSPWRDLPSSFGHWHRVYVRYNHWSKKGNWNTIFEAFTGDADLEYLMVDGSIVRVHQHSASKKEQPSEAEGHSRGGLSTKIHATVDSLGNVIRFCLTEGQASEYGEAEKLIKGFSATYVLADKGCDSNDFIEAIHKMGAVPVVPPRKNRIVLRDYDTVLYKARNLVEHFF